MSNDSKKPKVEQEYSEYDIAIESKTQEELKKLKERIAHLKKEAEKIGSTLESLDEKEQS